MIGLKFGDRVRGIHNQKGKLGVVVIDSPIYRGFVTLKWDGGKRVSHVDKANLELVEESAE